MFLSEAISAPISVLVDHVLDTDLDAAVELRVEATCALILDGTDTIVHAVHEEDLGSDVPEAILVVEPLDNGGGTVLGQGGIPLTSNPLGILTRIVVLARGETLDLDEDHDATVDDVTDLGDGLGISELGDVTIVGIEGGIHVSETDKLIGVIDIHVLADSAESVMGVQTEGVGLLVVFSAKQLLAKGGIVNTIVPSVETIIDRSVVESGFLAESSHVISLEAERHRSALKHLVAARDIVNLEVLVSALGLEILDSEAIERGSAAQTGRDSVIVDIFLRGEYSTGEIINGIDRGTRYDRGVITSGVVVRVEHVEGKCPVVAGLLGDFLFFDFQDLDLTLAVILLVDPRGTGVPSIVPGLAKVESKASMKSKVRVELLGDPVLHSGLMVEIGLIEKSPRLEVKRESLLGIEELAVLELGMAAPEIV